MGPETLLFWQAPGDSSAAGLGTQYVFWGPRVRVAGTVIIQPPLWSTPYLYTLILRACDWSLEPQDRTEAAEGVIPEFFPIHLGWPALRAHVTPALS